MKRYSLLAAIAAASLAMASSAFAEKIANPEYTNWAKFKAGASAKVEGTSVAAGNTTKNTTTTTLKEITADKAVVEITMSMEMMGNKMDMPPQSRTIEAKIDAPSAPATPAPNSDAKTDVKTSEETVKVDGKDIKCKVAESDSDANGMKTHAKTWTSEEVPGMVVKVESKTTGAVEATTSQTLVSFTTGK